MPARFHTSFFLFLVILLGTGGPVWSGGDSRVLVLGDAPRYDLAPYLEVLDAGDVGLTIDPLPPPGCGDPVNPAKRIAAAHSHRCLPRGKRA